jgi:hypothetical protein
MREVVRKGEDPHEKSGRLEAADQRRIVRDII